MEFANISSAEGLGFLIESPDLEDLRRRVRRVLTKEYQREGADYSTSIFVDMNSRIMGYKFFKLDTQRDGSQLPVKIGRLPKEIKETFNSDLRRFVYDIETEPELIQR